MRFPLTGHVARSGRHTTFYMACGPLDGPPIIFIHGWPELSISWRHQLACFGAMGFRAIAPDMRGYGRSSVYSRHEDYALREITRDMIELLDSLGCEKAVWVGHDWGSPVVWSLASHHPDRCHGVANLCVPYIPDGFAPCNLIPLADRAIYPEAEYPAAQWDYMLFYGENFEKAKVDFEKNIPAMVKLFYRAGDSSGDGRPTHTATVRKNGGWFAGLPGPIDPPRDENILAEEDLHQYVSALQRNGFFGPDSWYMNANRNIAFAREATHEGRITLPVLFLHAEYDWVCETTKSRLATPMRESCQNLTEATTKSGHWMAQEKPDFVSAAIVQWIGRKLQIWPTSCLSQIDP